MIDVVEARRRAEAALADLRCAPGDNLVVIDEMTRMKPYGWVFFWDSRMRIITGDGRYAVIGPGPIIIDRETGSHHYIGSAYGADRMIAEFEERKYGRRFD